MLDFFFNFFVGLFILDIKDFENIDKLKLSGSLIF